MDIVFNYPAPVAKPKPISAKLHPVAQIDLSSKTVSGFYQEWYENKMPGGQPVLSTERRPYKVKLSETQLMQIMEIVAIAAQQQGELVPGSTVTTGGTITTP